MKHESKSPSHSPTRQRMKPRSKSPSHSPVRKRESRTQLDVDSPRRKERSREKRNDDVDTSNAKKKRSRSDSPPARQRSFSPDEEVVKKKLKKEALVAGPSGSEVAYLFV